VKEENNMADRKSKAQVGDDGLIRLTTYVPLEKHGRIVKLSGPKGVSAWIAHAIELGLKDGFKITRSTVAKVEAA